MSSARAQLFFLSFLSFALLGIVACSGDDGAAAAAAKAAPATVGPTRVPSPIAASPSPAPTLPAPTATPPPAPTAAPTPAGAVQFKPPQLVQGGFAFVYLNEAATSATASFGEKQYPLLHDGTRWWTLIGIGALARPGLAPVTVTYTPAGRTTLLSVVQSIPIVQRDFLVEKIYLDAQTAALLAPDIIQAELAQRAAIYSGFTAQRLWSGPFLPPSRAPIGDVYGTGRSYNDAPIIDYHRGTDFTARLGDPVTAAATGRAAFAGSLKVRGGSVILDHGAGVFTAYHHLSQIDVAQGQLVNAGDRLGATGSTGLVTGPHLHWEVVVRGIEVDGELWLKGTEIGP